MQQQRSFALIFALITALCLSSVALAQPAPPPPGGSPAQATLVQGNNAFAAALYRQLAPNALNLVVSPFSIQQAFGMVYAGAAGNTEAEIATVLQYGSTGDALHKELKLLTDDLVGRGSANGQFSVGNSLWAEQSYYLDQAYFLTVGQWYGNAFQFAPFSSNPEESRQRINGWVGEKTNQQIQELLPSGTVDANTKLVLANALYFEGKWETPFALIGNRDFTALDGGVVSAPMMEVTSGFNVAGSTDMKAAPYVAVSMPYVGSGLAMLAVMPHSDFASYEATLSAEMLQGIIGTLQPQGVQLSLPKWRAEFATSLKDALQAMGMTTTFDPASADFSRMSYTAASDGLHIQNVLHKAFINVNEEGTIAAAATAAVMGIRSNEVALIEFNRPFIYAIYDTQTRAILFIGRVVNPAL